MMNYNDDIEQRIEKYLNNTLSEGERSLFDQELVWNEHLRSQLYAEKAIRETIFTAKMQNLGQLIEKDFEKAYRVNFLKYWMLGLFVTILTGAIVIFAFINHHESKQVTFSKEVINQVTSEENLEVKPQKNLTENRKENSKVVNKTPSKEVIIDKVETKNDIFLPDSKEENRDTVEENVVKIIQTPPSKELKLADSSEIIVKAKNCPEESQQIDYSITQPMLGEEYGKIALKGDYGISDYETTLHNKDEGNKIYDLNYVPVGRYQIQISNSECQVSSANTLVMAQTGCAKTNEIFAPELGDLWSIAIVPGREAILTIRSGSAILFTVKADYGDKELIWDGKMPNGELANLGLHFYELRYNNTEVCRGTITVAR